MSIRETYRPYLCRERGARVDDIGADRSFRYAVGEGGLNLRWFAAETLPQRELFARHHLLQRNVITFLPKRLRTIRHGRRLHTEEAALFPGYLFVQLDLAQHRWRDINTTPGVRQILTSGGSPVQVRAGIVESLIESSDNEGIIYFMGNAVGGGRVHLVAGSCAAELGALGDLDGLGRLAFLFRLLNRQVRPNFSTPAQAF